MYHIQIVGAGYVGSAIAAYFRSKQQKVWTVNRSEKRKQAFVQMGATPVIADLNKPETLSAIPPAHFIVLCPAPDERSEDAYIDTYLVGIANYLKAIEKNPRPHLIVYLSSTGVYGHDCGSWVDESTPPEPKSEKGKILLRAEEQILNSGYASIVFRLSGIYGPGRHVAKRFEARCGKLEKDSWANMIHLDDIVQAMPKIFNDGKAGNVYLGVDDTPVKRSEFCSWLGTQLGEKREALQFSSEPGGKRCSNKRLKELGVEFKYPSFQEGYKEILANE